MKPYPNGYGHNQTRPFVVAAQGSEHGDSANKKYQVNLDLEVVTRVGERLFFCYQIKSIKVVT